MVKPVIAPVVASIAILPVPVVIPVIAPTPPIMPLLINPEPTLFKSVWSSYLGRLFVLFCNC
ncbi:hypothetical protein [Commensalibacter intestini]|uniref:hypothetical protein n=1 Tax=Commensalibacter intestini TaxID=479936 RepID=UPI001185E453|nr:hypothetical protein [Commensalibacter intestini]